MKKSFLNSIIPLAVFMLYISINGFSQIQNPNWVLFTTGDATATIGTTNIRFNSAPTIHYNENNTSYKNTPREFRDENNQPITNYRGFNSFFDNDGFPVLYVINKNQKTYLFDKHGKLISKKHENPNGYLYFLKNNPTGGNNPNYYDNKNFIEGFNEQLFSNTSNPMLENTSREISILKVGCNLLHVIAGSMIIEVDLSLKSWDYFLPKTNNNGSINCSFIQNKGIYSVKCGNGSMVFRETVHSIRRDPTNEARYFIHYLYTSDNVILGESNSILLNTITVDANNYSVDYGPSFFLKHPSLPRRYGVSPQFVAELEVSPDGSKIAVHDDNSIFVYNINSSTKQVTGLLGWYIFGAATNTQNFAISGLEFNSNSTQLIFNRFNYGAPQFTQVQNNIGVLNLNNISSGQFACTWISEDPTGKTQSIVSRGGLELGRDGNIYSVGALGLYKINLNTMSLEDALILLNTSSVNLSNDNLYGANFAIRPLPEQIDGQTFIPEGYHLDDDVITYPIDFNNNITSSGFFKIRGEIKINLNEDQQASVIFNNMQINPANGCVIRVLRKSILIFNNSNIQTDNCNKMWQGIIVENGGGLKILNSSAEEKFIKDAILAIDYQGKESGLEINNYTFNRNERTLKITDGSATENITFWGNIKISGNNFRNTEVLKDLSKGQSAINLLNANKGISAIEVNQTGTATKDLILESNNFEGGLFGVKASNSYIKIAGCRFSNIKGIANVNFLPRINVNYGSAIFVEKNDNSIGNYSLSVGVNTNNIVSSFSENSRHITVYNGVSLKVNSVNFSYSYQKAIEWVKNKGCSLDIIGSSFLNCANSGIYCDDNAFPVKLNTERTYLKIEGNTFRNDKFDLNGNTTQFLFNGNAILINDLGKTANTGYNHLEVSSNQINNLRTGIVVSGVTGEKKDLRRPEVGTSNYNINTNGPILIRPNSTTMMPSGIHVVNSMYLAFFQNYDLFSEMVKGIPNEGNAIYIENSPFISVKSNSLKGKYGLRAKMNNIGSEILCNTFSRNRFGIMMSDKHMLRSRFITHGIKDAEARPNKFIQTGISDIQWEFSTNPVSNWWIIERNGKVKESCLLPGSKLNCPPIVVFQNNIPKSFPNKIVVGDAPDIICNGQFPAGLVNEIIYDTLADPISQWELDFTHAINSLKNKQEIVFSDKVKLIKAIEYTQTNTFDSALKLLNPPFENKLDQQYASLLKKYIGFYYPTPRMPDSLEKSEIKAIAQQIPSEKGSHVYLARSIMQSLYDEQFAEKDIAYQDVYIELLNTSCVLSDSNLKVLMQNATGTEIPIQYAFDEQYHLQIFGESLQELASNEIYLIKITHQGISYSLSKSLGNFFKTKNSITLECNTNLGKRSITEKQITQEGAAISVFPNPVSQYLSIKGIPETDILCDISMLDMLGRSVLEVKQHPANKDLDVSKLPSGVYCLIIKQGHQHHRFLLNKE